MTENLTKIYDGADLSGANPNVIYLPILADAELRGVDVKTDANVSGDAVFSLKLNGAAVTGALAAITISNGTKIGSVSDLEIALVKGDEIVLDMTSGDVSIPLTLNLVVDDGKTINDLLPGQTDNAGKVLGTDGTNASWVTPSGGGGSFPGYSIDVPPTSPSSFNAEFDGSSIPSGWTQRNRTNITTVRSFEKSLAIQSRGSGADSGVSAIYNTVSGDFDIVAKLTVEFTGGGYAMGAGIYLNTVESAAPYLFGLIIASDETTHKLGCIAKWNADYTYEGNQYNGISGYQYNGITVSLLDTYRAYYYRVKSVSDTQTFYISKDGVSWYQVYTTSAFGIIESVGIGLQVYNASSVIKCYCDWIRDYQGQSLPL